MIVKSELKNVKAIMNNSIISVEKDDTIRLAIRKMVAGTFVLLLSPKKLDQ